MSSKPTHDATRCVHAGEERHGRKASITTDIAQASVFVLPDINELRRYAEGRSNAYLYTRYANPTTDAAEAKIAALEGAEACVVTASGMAATFCAALTALQAGDEVVSMLDVYGGTLKMFESVLSRYGVTTHFVPYHELPQIERYFTPRTRMLFLESPTNPTLRCVDLRGLAEIGRRHGACVVVDNTFATPILQKPLALGADMVVHSGTKYLGGHSDVTAGAVCGTKAGIDKVRDMMKLSGGCLDPMASYLMIRGLKTLEIRVERACRNARQIADFLHTHPKVERVFYPGFHDHDGHEIARRQMSDFGMMVSFDIKGGGPAAERVIDSLQLWYLATSLGGVESTVSYPVLSSHVGLSDDRLRLLDVSPATIRLSVGIENANDLITDLEQALAKAE
ncbi:MAG: PLP-dependent aspartate aminotransferase family protein [Terriglobales bacterium]